ncbi:a84 [Rat cytomegalovirus ALL-03]|uniref:A84 n=2 Tax=Rat cytomegalovirus (isolate England) TaxID=1261657 RepID=A0A0F6R564_RCMVE|nr:E84 [Murid betaherpesvirus 8]AKE44251.1 a84 [Rat cytomegalovirus ALL-03]AFX83398.1 E84 [Murid betaherpesvirus 8]WEG71871.1 protein UL84 [Murid betaherpesvirus 8]WPH25261.1 protein UL84 [Murid betaherpesvirus 8]WPH25394.1 protein UL84 [Murid betaherpesvirus 8]
MSATVHIPTALTQPTSRLSYVLELLVKLDTAFAPFETKLLKTGITITPQVPCIICIGKSSRRPCPPHTVNLITMGPTDLPRDISVEVTNPSARTLGHYHEAKLAIVIFAIPLVRVRMDLLCIQRNFERPRSKSHCSVNVLTITPDKKTLDLEITSSKLVWSPCAGNTRLTTTVIADIMRYDVRRFHTAEIKSYSTLGIYLEELAVTQSCGTLHATFVTTYESVLAPSSMSFKIRLKEEKEETLKEHRITFPRFPDPTVCVPQAYGLQIHARHKILLAPGTLSKIDIPLSYYSKGTYTGLFTPKTRRHVTCQFVVWKERQSLSFVVSSTAPVEIAQGDMLGDVNFIPSYTLRTKKITQTTTPSTRYTITVTGSHENTTKKQNRKSNRKNNQSTEVKTFPITQQPSTKRKRSTSGETEEVIIFDEPMVEQRSLTPSYEQFTDTDETVDVAPSGAVFKLKRLLPLLHHLDGRDPFATHSSPKKIARVLVIQILSCWQPGQRDNPTHDAYDKPRGLRPLNNIRQTTHNIATSIVSPLHGIDRLLTATLLDDHQRP